MDIEISKLRFDKSITAIYASDMRSFSTHLRSQGIDHFGYSKLFKGCRGFTLTTDPDFSEMFIQNNFHEEAFMADIELYQSGNFIWDFYFSDSLIVQALKEKLKLRSGVTLIRTKDNSECEFYYFASTSKNTSLMNNFYVNSLNYLENISDEFNAACYPIIKKGNENRIIYPGPFEDKLHVQIPFCEKKSNHLHPSNIIFTQREQLCLDYLLQGKKASETADILCVSRRTIEKHIENIKMKTGCKTKFELMKKFLSK